MRRGFSFGIALATLTALAVGVGGCKTKAKKDEPPPVDTTKNNACAQLADTGAIFLVNDPVADPASLPAPRKFFAAPSVGEGGGSIPTLTAEVSAENYDVVYYCGCPATLAGAGPTKCKNAGKDLVEGFMYLPGTSKNSVTTEVHELFGRYTNNTPFVFEARTCSWSDHALAPTGVPFRLFGNNLYCGNSAAIIQPASGNDYTQAKYDADKDPTAVNLRYHGEMKDGQDKLIQAYFDYNYVVCNYVRDVQDGKVAKPDPLLLNPLINACTGGKQFGLMLVESPYPFSGAEAFASAARDESLNLTDGTSDCTDAVVPALPVPKPSPVAQQEPPRQIPPPPLTPELPKVPPQPAAPTATAVDLEQQKKDDCDRTNERAKATYGADSKIAFEYKDGKCVQTGDDNSQAALPPQSTSGSDGGADDNTGSVDAGRHPHHGWAPFLGWGIAVVGGIGAAGAGRAAWSATVSTPNLRIWKSWDSNINFLENAKKVPNNILAGPDLLAAKVRGMDPGALQKVAKTGLVLGVLGLGIGAVVALTKALQGSSQSLAGGTGGSDDKRLNEVLRHAHHVGLRVVDQNYTRSHHKRRR